MKPHKSRPIAVKAIRFIKQHEEGLIVPILAGVTIIAWFVSILLKLGTDGVRGFSIATLKVAYEFAFDTSLDQPLYDSLRHFAVTLAKATVTFAGVYAYIRLMGINVGLLKLKFRFQSHVIICGLGKKAHVLAEDLLKNGEQVVIIDLDDKSESSLDLRSQGAVVIRGDARMPEIVCKARLDKARAVICITNDDQTNLRIANTCHALLNNNIKRKDESSPLACYCHVYDSNLRHLLSENPLFTKQSQFFVGRLFSIWERASEKLLETYPPDSYADICSSDAPPVHVLLAGFGPLAQSILIQLALMAHYRNGKRAVVTIIDRQVQVAYQRLISEYPALPNLLQVRIIDSGIEALSPNQLTEIRNVSGTDVPVSIVYVALGEDITTLSAARFIARLFGGRGIRGVVPVVACIPPKSSLISAVDTTALQDQGVLAFDPYSVCTGDVILNEALDLIAHNEHHRYLEKRLAQGNKIREKPTQYPWDELEEMVKDWNRHQIAHIPVKLRALGYQVVKIPEVTGTVEKHQFDEAEVEVLSIMEHRRWMADVQMSGWTYGDNYDWNLRTNPNLVSYDELPESEKNFDRSVIRGIPEVLAQYRQQIVLASRYAQV